MWRVGPEKSPFRGTQSQSASPFFYLLHFPMGTLGSTTTLSPYFSSKLSFSSSFHRLRFSASRSFLSIFRNPSFRAKRSVSTDTRLRVSASSTLGACSVLSLFVSELYVCARLCVVSYLFLWLFGCWETEWKRRKLRLIWFMFSDRVECTIWIGLLNFYALVEGSDWGFEFFVIFFQQSNSALKCN